MRPLRALVIYLGAVFIGGALLAPWRCRNPQIFPRCSGISHSGWRQTISRF